MLQVVNKKDVVSTVNFWQISLLFLGFLLLNLSTCLLGKVFQSFEEQQWLFYTFPNKQIQLKVSNENLNGNLTEDNPNEDIFKKQPPVLFFKKGVIKYFPKFIGNPADKKTSTRCLTKTSKKSCQDILQISKRCLKRKSERHLRKTSSRYLCKIYCRCLTKDVLKMSY